MLLNWLLLLGLSSAWAACPTSFQSYHASFAALFSSHLSKQITNDCHHCINKQSRHLNIKTAPDAFEWNCLQLVLAATKAPTGCASVCLRGELDQCMFVTTNSSAPITSPKCSSCVAEASPSAEHDAKQYCAKNCTTECQLPSECYLPSTISSDQSTCSLCLADSTPTSTEWKQSACFQTTSLGGCRPFCVPECGDSLVGTSTATGEVEYEECDDGNLNNGDGCSSTCGIEKGFSCSMKTYDSPSVCHEVCGDGIVVGREECDDDNLVNGDGCSSSCKVESGFDCSSSICLSICGDGLIVGNETCDDGNTKKGDGCSSKCFVENGFSCSNGTCSAVCGDNLILGSEECDDGNTKNGDGCSSSCVIESGFTCSSSGCSSICGDSLIVGNETCDDGNVVNGDGCSSLCVLEDGFTCPSSSSACVPTCGDGKLRGNEECDDGNLENGDGCSSSCTIEKGFTCPSSICTGICGDGIIVGNETCDDGNLQAGDGCSSCTIDTGFSCSASTSASASVCLAVCGDLRVLGAEACDDGNVRNGDGCSSACIIEAGFNCSSAGGACTNICGDGLIVGNETCDDGNKINGDGCSSCTIDNGFTCFSSPSSCSSTCGDGLRVASEACDDGNLADHDGCSSSCTVESGFNCSASTCSGICGDGVVVSTEECDDGNVRNGDGCSSACAVEGNCGDGVINPLSETCDDGNDVDGDGCSSSCVVETMPSSSAFSWTCPRPNAPCRRQCRSNLRIRKPWKNLSAAEQQLYRNAIAMAMESGLYAAFVGIHYENANELQAHATCSFLVWHRKYLLGFENMLRSLSNEFACLTLPYWGVFEDYAAFVAGQCTSMEQCSSILTGLGGSSAGTFRTLSVPGNGNIGGNCVSSHPLNNACPVTMSSHGNGTCGRCISRGNWGSSVFPSGLGYGAVAAIVNGNTRYQQVTMGLQRGFHNSVHSALGGLMATLASPADPIFFSHHAAVDMAYQIHHECAFGTTALSNQEKQTNVLAYEGCGTTPADGVPTSMSQIRMDAYDASSNSLVNIHSHPILARYFETLPQEHWEYVDSADIRLAAFAPATASPGENNFQYHVDDMVRNLLQVTPFTCAANGAHMFSSASRGLLQANEHESSGFTAKELVMLLQATKQPDESERLRRRLASYQYTQWFNATCGQARRYFEQEQRHVAVNSRWSNAQMTQMVLDQVTLIECLHYERTHGECEDFSQLFKQQFRITYQQQCRQLLEDLRTQRRVIVVPNWQHDCNYFFHQSPTGYS